MIFLPAFLSLILTLALVPSVHACVTKVTEIEEPSGTRLTASHFPSRRARNPLDDYANALVNHDSTSEEQNEEQACISPIDPNVMVAVWKDYSTGTRRVGHAYSHDGGLTWHDELFPQMYYDCQSDPSLAVDAQGIFTADIITFPCSANRSGIIQVSSYDGGVTWQDSVWAVHDLAVQNLEDKQMLAVDAVSGSPYQGTFYCTWRRFYNYPSGDSIRINLVLKRPGQPYSEPRVLSHNVNANWSNVCVGVNGKVYVSWLDYDDQMDHWVIKMSHSLDGGDTWSPDNFVVTPAFEAATIEPILLVFG